MEHIRQILPYLFVLFFLIKANKEPLYLLGIPFMMFMSNSIFFDTAKIFHKPGSLDYALILLWLAGLWLLALSFGKKRKEKSFESNVFNIADFCIFGLVLISTIDLVKVFIEYRIWDQVFDEFITLISLFFGYYIIKDWFSRNDPNLVIKFLFSLVVINSIASVFYFLNQGLHFNIYPNVESLQENFNGEDIERGFYFMPQFLFLSITFCLVFKKKYPLSSWLLLAVNLLAVYISFTRSYLIIVVLTFLFYFIFTGIKKKQLNLIFKNILLYSILAVVGILIISKIFPNKTKYLKERFTELTKHSSSSDGPNDLEFRFMNTKNVIAKIDRNKKMFGMGPLTVKQTLAIDDMQAATSDMAWTEVIFRWGFVGLGLFILLYIFSFFNAFKLFLNSEGAISNLALLCLLYIICQIIESFVSWTFMSGHGLTTGLWYFALLSAILKQFNNVPYIIAENKMNLIEEV